MRIDHTSERFSLILSSIENAVGEGIGCTSGSWFTLQGRDFLTKRSWVGAEQLNLILYIPGILAAIVLE